MRAVAPRRTGLFCKQPVAHSSLVRNGVVLVLGTRDDVSTALSAGGMVGGATKYTLFPSPQTPRIPLSIAAPRMKPAKEFRTDCDTAQSASAGASAAPEKVHHDVKHCYFGMFMRSLFEGRQSRTIWAFHIEVSLFDLRNYAISWATTLLHVCLSFAFVYAARPGDCFLASLC